MKMPENEKNTKENGKVTESIKQTTGELGYQMNWMIVFRSW